MSQEERELFDVYCLSHSIAPGPDQWDLLHEFTSAREAAKADGSNLNLELRDFLASRKG